MNPKAFFNRRNIYLILTLLLVSFGLAFTSNYLNYRMIQGKLGASEEINIAGRQRMMSQKLTKSLIALQINRIKVKTPRELYLEFRADLKYWELAHEKLQHIFTSSIEQRGNSQLKKRWELVIQHYNALFFLLNSYEKTDLTRDKRILDVDELLKLESSYLDAMDSYVNARSLDLKYQINRSFQFNLIFGFCLELIIFLFVIYVVSPYIKKVEEQSFIDSVLITKKRERNHTRELFYFGRKIAHEVVNPLSAAISAVNRMKDSKRLTEDELFKLVSAASLALSRMNQVITNLVSLSPIPREEYGPIDIPAVAIEAIQLIKMTHFLNYEVQAHTPHPIQVKGLEIDFYQVFQNLLVNAVESINTRISKESGFVPASPAVLITIKAVDNGQFAEIRVSDCGLGIDREEYHLQDLPLGSSKEIRNEEHGFARRGMGLAIVKQIVLRYPGSIFCLRRLKSGGSEAIWRLPM